MTEEPDYVPDEDDLALFREMDERQKLCDAVAIKSVTAGQALLLSFDEADAEKCTDIGFVRSLYFTLLGSLNARDIPLTRKNLEVAFEVCFDEHAAAIMLNPHQAGTDRARFKTPAAETFITNLDDSADKEAQRFMDRIRDKLRMREQIRDAVVQGARNIIADTKNDPPEVVIDKVRDRFTSCLRQQLEAGYPGITSDKDNPVWKDPLTLAHTLGRENIVHGVNEALKYSVTLMSDDEFEKLMDERSARPPAPQ